ncbi:glutamate receptor 2.7-like isoform X2 [Andrographis paniculata]|nr:glutamate receptor 2.7-like isoform X2 [Andrographis paniculata]
MFEWKKVILLYEDAGSGTQFLSRTIKSFQDVDIRLERMNSIPTAAEDRDILKKLDDLKKEETKVFVVHMSPALGFRFFKLADASGMMSKDYAWIITDSLSILLNSSNFNVDGSMDGVLGIRPYAFAAKRFEQRWKRIMLGELMNSSIMKVNIYGLWAYDAVTSLAIAVEEIGSTNSSSSYGPRLLRKLLRTKLKGLTGNFQLVDGKLKPSLYEIFNIVGTGEKRLGFWTPKRRIVSDLRGSGASTDGLRKIVWPGDSVIAPKGSRIPANGILRVGIPCKPGFKEFVDLPFDDPEHNCKNATGFAMDIFRETLKVLPFPVNPECYCYHVNRSTGKTYDDMLRRIPQDYDIVVGETTIWSPRTEFVDFSLPYSETGVVLVVRNRRPLDIWIFIKPLRWDLWLAIIVACVYMGVALHILERRAIVTDEQATRPRPGLINWSPIAILAFPERNLVSNKWSVFTLVCWIFMAYILMQSFTASLSAILTVDQLKFAFSENYYIGYHDGSFLESFLKDQLHINGTRLKSLGSLEEFDDAMMKGSKNGGVDAIIDVVPYMKLFLNKYEPRYKKVGPTYRTNGFGFAFEKGSPLVQHFSRAILNVTQGSTMNNLEQKNFGPGYSSQDPMSSEFSQGNSELTLRDFAGLFLIVGSLTLLALFCSETSIGQKMSGAVERLIANNCTCSTVQVHSTVEISVTGDTNHGEGDNSCESDNPFDTSQHNHDEIETPAATTNEVVIVALEVENGNNAV